MASEVRKFECAKHIALLGKVYPMGSILYFSDKMEYGFDMKGRFFRDVYNQENNSIGYIDSDNFDNLLEYNLIIEFV